MKNVKFLYLILFVFAVSFYSCEDEVSELQPAEVVADYLKAQSMDLPSILTNADGQKFVTAAPADGDLSAKYIVDIRSADAYAAGHIAGAKNVAFGDILTEAASADKPILVVCYTGQTACYATSLLRLYGYSDAQALKWGMSGWCSTTDSWTGNIADIADGHGNWTTDVAPASMTFEYPDFDNLSTEGQALLKERVEKVVAEGFKGVNGSEVINNPSDYFINNYFSEADYVGFGHIDGAYRILPLSIADGSVKNLDPSKKVVTYCYTGQTSAVITAFLRVMGYDAYSLKFGMNGLYNSNSSWKSNQWGGDSHSKELCGTLAN